MLAARLPEGLCELQEDFVVGPKADLPDGFCLLGGQRRLEEGVQTFLKKAWNSPVTVTYTTYQTQNRQPQGPTLTQAQESGKKGPNTPACWGPQNVVASTAWRSQGHLLRQGQLTLPAPNALQGQGHTSEPLPFSPWGSSECTGLPRGSARTHLLGRKSNSAQTVKGKSTARASLFRMQVTCTSAQDRQPTGGKVERASPRGAGHDCAAFLRLVGGPGAMLRSAGCARTSKRASKPSCEAGEADNSNVRRR